MDSIERIKMWKSVFQDDKKSLSAISLLIFALLIVIALFVMICYSARFVEATQLILIITALILSLYFLLIFVQKPRIGSHVVVILSLVYILMLLSSPVFLNDQWLPYDDSRYIISVIHAYLNPSAFEGDPSIVYLKEIHPPGLPLVAISLFLISGLDFIFILKIIILFLGYLMPQLYYKISINVTKNEKIGLATAFLSITVPASMNIFSIGSYSSIGAFLYLLVLYFMTLPSKNLKWLVLIGISVGTCIIFHPFSALATAVGIFGLNVMNAIKKRSFRPIIDLFVIGVVMVLSSALYLIQALDQDAGSLVTPTFLVTTGVGLTGGRAEGSLVQPGTYLVYLVTGGLIDLKNPFSVGLEEFVWSYHFTVIHMMGLIGSILFFIGFVYTLKTRREWFWKPFPLILSLVFLIVLLLFSTQVFGILVTLRPPRYLPFIISVTPIYSGIGFVKLLNKVRGIKFKISANYFMAALIAFISIFGILEAILYPPNLYTPSEQYDACLWLRTNTNSDSIVSALPRYADSVRMYAERPTISSHELGGFSWIYQNAYFIWKETAVDTYIAHFTQQEAQLIEYIQKYSVTYFFIDLNTYGDKQVEENLYYDLSPDILPYLKNNHPLLQKLTASFLETVYMNGNILIVHVLNTRIPVSS
ncbi:MAG: hypothetical protein ACFFCD_05840 [Promethearchaeota archaeon]